MSVYTTMMPDWQYLYLQANTHNIWGMHILLMRRRICWNAMYFSPLLDGFFTFQREFLRKGGRKGERCHFLTTKVIAPIMQEKVVLLLPFE